MEKRLAKKEIREIEAHTWAVMERCLERTPPENRTRVKDILTEINQLALVKGYYNTMGLFFSHFFSSFAVLTVNGAGQKSISERLKKRNSDLGILKRTGTGGLSKVQNLSLGNEIEIALAQLSDLLKDHFKKSEQILGASKDEIQRVERIEARKAHWRDKTRLIEAARLLEAIGHEETYKVLSDLLKLVPPYETVSRKTLFQRINRKA